MLTKVHLGYVDDLPDGHRFDAATLIGVLHHLPGDEAKRHILRSIAARLLPGAPLILAGNRHAYADHPTLLAAWGERWRMQGSMPDEVRAKLGKILQVAGRGRVREADLVLLKPVLGGVPCKTSQRRPPPPWPVTSGAGRSRNTEGHLDRSARMRPATARSLLDRAIDLPCRPGCSGSNEGRPSRAGHRHPVQLRCRLCPPGAGDARLGDPRVAEAAGPARHPVLCRRRPRPGAIPHRGHRCRLRRHPGRSGAGGGRAAILGQRRLQAAARMDRGRDGAHGRAVRDREHRRHGRLAAGAGLPGQAAADRRRHRPGDGAHLPRRPAGFRAVRTALRHAGPRRQHDAQRLCRSGPRDGPAGSRSPTRCRTSPTRPGKRWTRRPGCGCSTWPTGLACR